MLRHTSLARRALRHAVGAATAIATGLVLCCACQRESATEAAGARPAAAGEVHRLIELFEPMDKTVTSDISDHRFHDGQELLARLSQSDRAVGLEALRVLRQDEAAAKTFPIDVERALLTVAARAAPTDSAPLLENLTTTYGATLALRTEACLLFAEVAPTRALEVLEPLVKKVKPGQTLPPAEFLVKSWVIACDKANVSPVPLLCDVATNMFQDESARVFATKALGGRKEPLAVQALNAILVESTGDGYLRRKAAQGLLASLDQESACKLFTHVADNEGDLNMLQFLRDLLDKNCGGK